MMTNQSRGSRVAEGSEDAREGAEAQGLFSLQKGRIRRI